MNRRLTQSFVDSLAEVVQLCTEHATLGKLDQRSRSSSRHQDARNWFLSLNLESRAVIFNSHEPEWILLARDLLTDCQRTAKGFENL